MMSPEDANECFRLALTGAAFKDIAVAKNVSVTEARQAIESEVAQRADPDKFESLDDALDYLRLGRLQRSLWAEATNGEVGMTRQVLQIVEKRNKLKKVSSQERSLTQAVHDMMHANEIDLSEETEDNE